MGTKSNQPDKQRQASSRGAKPGSFTTWTWKEPLGFMPNVENYSEIEVKYLNSCAKA